MPKTRRVDIREHRVAVHGAASIGVRRVRDAVDAVLHGEGASASVAVTFVGSRRMRHLNREHLGHNTLTDVLSFALPHSSRLLLGDIYICPLAAARNARQHGSAVRDELLRLVVHGTLHLLGYDHPVGPTRTRSAMWRRQEHYVAALA